jgi:hypothetical protein
LLHRNLNSFSNIIIDRLPLLNQTCMISYLLLIHHHRLCSVVTGLGLLRIHQASQHFVLKHDQTLNLLVQFVDGLGEAVDFKLVCLGVVHLRDFLNISLLVHYLHEVLLVEEKTEAETDFFVLLKLSFHLVFYHLVSDQFSRSRKLFYFMSEFVFHVRDAIF